MSENPYDASKRERMKRTPAVVAALAGVMLAGTANKAADATPDTYMKLQNEGNTQQTEVPVKDLDKNSTVTIKVRKDETAGGIAQDLMAQPEDYTKLVDEIQDSQEVPSVLNQGTVAHLDSAAVDPQALAERRRENSAGH